MTEDQQWCADRARFCEDRGAPTVAKLLRDAAADPSKATICREEMNRAAQGVKAIKRLERGEAGYGDA